MTHNSQLWLKGSVYGHLKIYFLCALIQCQWCVFMDMTPA